MTFLFVVALLGCIVLGFLYWMESDRATNLERKIADINETAARAQHSAWEGMNMAEAATRELENHKENFRRRIRSLRDRLKHRLLQKHDAPGRIVDSVFEEWIEEWDEN